MTVKKETDMDAKSHDMEPQADRFGVHVEHCCVRHGCKYSNDNCPVASGSAKQTRICEECEADGITDLEMLGEVVAGTTTSCPYCGQVLGSEFGKEPPALDPNCIRAIAVACARRLMNLGHDSFLDHREGSDGIHEASLIEIEDAVIAGAEVAQDADIIRQFVRRVNARAEADMLAGNPITGAHHRALEAEVAALQTDPAPAVKSGH